MSIEADDRASAEDPWDRDMLDVLLTEVERSGTELSDADLDGLTDKTIQSAAKGGCTQLLRALKRRLPKMLKEHADERIGFEQQLHSLWGRALDRLYMLVVVSRETGADYNQALRPSAAARRDVVFEALVRLHAKACRIALEGHHLLESGFASGAYARWRTLHEVAVTSSVILHSGHDTAERYLLHQVIEAYKAAEDYAKYHERLGYAAPEPSEIDSLRERRAELLNRYGEEYRHTYGWAAAALGIKKPTFLDLEVAANLDHYRPLYGLSNHSIHSGSRSLHFDMGLVNGEEILLVGRSNAGLAKPGHSIALSLLQTTAAMIGWSPRMKDLIVLHAMIRLADQIGKEFHRAHLEYMAHAEQLSKRKSGDEDDVPATE